MVVGVSSGAVSSPLTIAEKNGILDMIDESLAGRIITTGTEQPSQ